MLGLCLAAGLPLIAVTSDDLVNIEQVLSTIAGQPVKEAVKQGKSDLVFQSTIGYTFRQLDKIDWEVAYHFLAKSGKTLIVVNPREVSTTMFDAGVVPLPKKMLLSFLRDMIDEEAKIHEVAGVLGGLSLKGVGELCMLCMAKSGALTARSIVDTKRIMPGAHRGMQQVDTNYLFYSPDAQIEKWLSREGVIFKRGAPELLQPRGLLLAGSPGTGKTLASKYLAAKLEVPLYRLDLSGILGKYVGESEKSLSTVLSSVERSTPCVLLIDEVEKLFHSKDDSGVTTRLLSALLWWLQEHRSKILTVMTTNDQNNIPKELVRPGRIDDMVIINELEPTQALEFAVAVYRVMSKKLGLKPAKPPEFTKYIGPTTTYSHADVTKTVANILRDEVIGLYQK